MRSTLSAVLVAGVLGIAALAHSYAAGQERDPGFVGAGKCKSCHKSKKKGNQYGTWEVMKHAQAYKVLGSVRARQLGQAAGVADPQKDGKCLRCHVTAYGEPPERIDKKYDITMGVQCESCHGAAGKHAKMQMMDEEGGKVSPGEVVANPPVKVCLRCHNPQSPTFQGFCYAERVADIRHLNPEKDRTGLEGPKCICPGGTCACKGGMCGIVVPMEPLPVEAEKVEPAPPEEKAKPEEKRPEKVAEPEAPPKEVPEEKVPGKTEPEAPTKLGEPEDPAKVEESEKPEERPAPAEEKPVPEETVMPGPPPVEAAEPEEARAAAAAPEPAPVPDDRAPGISAWLPYAVLVLMILGMAAAWFLFRDRKRTEA